MVNPTSLRDAAPDAPTVRCVLCGKSRAEVQKLVSGEGGAVCDACVGHALASFDTEPTTRAPGRYVHLGTAIGTILESLPSRTPLYESAPLFFAAIALANGHADELRALVPHTSSLGQYPMVLEIFDRIPEAERTFGDLVDRADALYYLDRVGELLDELDAVDPATLVDEDRAALWSLRAAGLSRLPWPDVEQAEPAIRCVEAIIEGSDAREALDDAFRSMLAIAQMRVFVARSRPELALPWFSHLDPNFAEPQFVMGEVYAALQRSSEATAAFGRALELSHPETALAAAARTRLGR